MRTPALWHSRRYRCPTASTCFRLHFTLDTEHQNLIFFLSIRHYLAQQQLWHMSVFLLMIPRSAVASPFCPSCVYFVSLYWLASTIRLRHVTRTFSSLNSMHAAVCSVSWQWTNDATPHSKVKWFKHQSVLISKVSTFWQMISVCCLETTELGREPHPLITTNRNHVNL